MKSEHHMKRNLSICILLLSLCSAASPFRTVLPERAQPHETTAEKELTHYLNLVAEQGLTVGGNASCVFHIGDTPLAREKGLSPDRLRDEEWVVKSFGRNIVISGGGTRGTLYGVYNFLEKQCGIRWWNPEEEYVPETKSLSLSALDMRGKPVFIYRNVYRWPMADDMGRFAARSRINHNGPNRIASQYGGAFYYGPPKHVHTFDEYIPEAKYRKEHPEYFALVGGERKGGNFRGQLCLSNPEVRTVFLNRLYRNIRAGRHMAVFYETAEPRLYDISQNDDAKPCSCPGCLAQIEKHGYSGQILLFVNSLAREVRKTHPDIMLTTLAYGYSLPPPKDDIRAEDNVIVKICRSATNAGVSIHHRDNAVFADTLRTWKKHAANLFVWDYAVSYWDGIKGLPFASELSYQEKHRFYHANSVTGVFWEHEYPHLADMYDLKVYLEARLMENPDLDFDGLLGDFMEKYYGSAGKYVYAYRKRIDRAMLENKGYIGGNPRLCTFEYLDENTMLECHELMDQAEKAVKDSPLFVRRVRRARLGLDRFTCRKGAGRPLPYFGGNLPPSRLDFASAEKRVMEYLPDAWKIFPPSRDRDVLQKEIELEIRQYHIPALKKTLPVPEKFRGRRGFDFNANYFEDHSHGRHKLVKVTDNESGLAVKIDCSDPKYYRLPWEMGFYNTAAAKGFNWIKIGKPAGKGYHWYPLGHAENLRDSFLLLNAAWTTQFHFLWDEVLNRPFEVWVSLKFEGKDFFPEDKRESAVYLERVVFLEP